MTLCIKQLQPPLSNHHLSTPLHPSHPHSLQTPPPVLRIFNRNLNHRHLQQVIHSYNHNHSHKHPPGEALVVVKDQDKDLEGPNTITMMIMRITTKRIITTIQDREEGGRDHDQDLDHCMMMSTMRSMMLRGEGDPVGDLTEVTMTVDR